MTDDKTPSSNVGYRRPPLASRFRKGQSGNPAGRTQGSRNRRRPEAGNRLSTLIMKEAFRAIAVDENGEEARMPVAQVVIRSLVTAAAKGDPRAQAVFLKMVSDSEESPAARMLDVALDQAQQEPHEVIIKIVDPAPPK